MPTAMQLAVSIPPEDLRLIHEMLPHAEARALKATVEAVAEFASAPDKAACAARISLRLKPLGVRGLSPQALYRKAAAVRCAGWRGAVDGRLLRKLRKGAIAENRDFVEHWQTLVAANQRKTAPAYRRLIEALARGETIPGLGTWQDLWRTEHEGSTPPSVCPYSVESAPPGLSYPSLVRLAPTVFGVRAARVGLMSATMDFAPDVLRTRIGLKRCQVIQIDDMWDNAKTTFGKNRFGERVVELSAVDVLTGKIICYLSKPVIRREDDTRQTIRAEWTRYILGHICCNLGVPDRMLVMGEGGTAAVDDDLRKALAEVSGDSIACGKGGMLSQPLAKGLYDGRPKGNPKYKGLIECLHSLKQNEMADIKGQIGSRDSLGNEPETVYGMTKTELALATAVSALERDRPGIRDRLSWPWMPWADYCVAKAAAYDAVNRRDWHTMEGWEDCGFVVAEWRPQPGMPWMPWSSLESMGEAASAMRRVVESDPRLFRARRMSPDEAWAARAGDVRPLGDWAMPLILGPGLARECQVSQKLEMEFRDETTMRSLTVYALVDGMPLQRGASYRVWVNPCAPATAYVADLQGRYIGTAKVSVAANADDMDALKLSLGVRQQAIAAEVKALRPIANRRLREANAAAARNSIEILGFDPAAQTESAVPVAPPDFWAEDDSDDSALRILAETYV